MPLRPRDTWILTGPAECYEGNIDDILYCIILYKIRLDKMYFFS
jgi:hypothetical protein